uniref:Uncharacterized protein n=1 Tax=Rhipicephalus zambeziensis TaxID=60191 RepID=A0A224Y740_9ACAR
MLVKFCTKCGHINKAFCSSSTKANKGYKIIWVTIMRHTHTICQNRWQNPTVFSQHFLGKSSKIIDIKKSQSLVFLTFDHMVKTSLLVEFKAHILWHNL